MKSICSTEKRSYISASFQTLKRHRNSFKKTNSNTKRKRIQRIELAAFNFEGHNRKCKVRLPLALAKDADSGWGKRLTSSTFPPSHFQFSAVTQLTNGDGGAFHASRRRAALASHPLRPFPELRAGRPRSNFDPLSSGERSPPTATLLPSPFLLHYR